MKYYNDDGIEEGQYSIGSYRKLEDILADQDSELESKLRDNKIIIQNNVYIVPKKLSNPTSVHQSDNSLTAISRVELNIADGYAQHTILSGSVEDKNPHETSNWFNDEINGPKAPTNSGHLIVSPHIYAQNVFDIAFSKKDIGKKPVFLFSERTDFIDAFMGFPVANNDSLYINDARNPSYVQLDVRFNDLRSFNDIYSYVKAHGIPTFADMCSTIVCINYFVHEVLNIIMPRNIVIIIESHSERVAIPPKTYIPLRPYPMLQIPDYDNKFNHVVAMATQIAKNRIFPKTLGTFRLKLSITPAIFTINFVSEYSPSSILTLTMSSVDNQVLYDAEVRHSIYPGKYMNTGPYIESSSYMYNRKYFGDNVELLRTIQNDYHTKLYEHSYGEDNIIDEEMQNLYGIDNNRSYDIEPMQNSYRFKSYERNYNENHFIDNEFSYNDDFPIINPNHPAKIEKSSSDTSIHGNRAKGFSIKSISSNKDTAISPPSIRNKNETVPILFNPKINGN